MLLEPRIDLGKIQSSDFLTIWNSDQMQRLRQSFLEGNPVFCKKQMQQLQCHHSSLRRPQPSNPLTLKTVLNTPPRRIDFRINGKCNLQCTMCEVWREPNGVFDESDFWESGPSKIFPFLQEVDMVNGEPFVQRDTFRFIEAVTAVNPHCSWAFYTNGQFKFTGKIESLLETIKLRWIQISLDSLDAVNYAKIRKGGTLKKTLENLEAWRTYRRQRVDSGKSDFCLRISMAVQTSNWHEIPRFINFAKRKGLRLHVQFVEKPFAASLLSLDEQKRLEILEFLLAVEPRTSLRWVLPPLRHSLSGIDKAGSGHVDLAQLGEHA